MLSPAARVRHHRRLKLDSDLSAMPTLSLDPSSMEADKHLPSLPASPDRARVRSAANSSKRDEPVLLLSHLTMTLLSRYGISYHGASQSASGTKEQVKQYREQNQAVFKSIQDFQRGTKEAIPDAAPTSSTELRTRQSHQTVGM